MEHVERDAEGLWSAPPNGWTLYLLSAAFDVASLIRIDRWSGRVHRLDRSTSRTHTSDTTMKRFWIVIVAFGLAFSAVMSGSASAKGPWLKCSLVSRSVIASTLGLNLLSGRGTRAYPWTTSCAYFGKSKDSPLVVVRYQGRFFQSTAFVRQYGSDPRNHRVTGGIGNLIYAYYYEGPSPGEVSLSVLGIRTVFQIQAFSNLARIKALAKKIAPLA